MSSFDSSVGRRPARSTGAPDTLTRAPRPNPAMARYEAARRAAGPSYLVPPDARRRAILATIARNISRQPAGRPAGGGA